MENNNIRIATVQEAKLNLRAKIGLHNYVIIQVDLSPVWLTEVAAWHLRFLD